MTHETHSCIHIQLCIRSETLSRRQTSDPDCFGSLKGSSGTSHVLDASATKEAGWGLDFSVVPWAAGSRSFS